MPLFWVSLHMFLAIGMSHNEIHQNLIMKGDAGAEFLRTQHSLWSGLARILPLQERTTSGVRGTREVKPYAIRGPQAVVFACPREYRASDRVSLLGQSGLCRMGETTPGGRALW
jgi:hypothetical protein